jgi:hypothetical protein
MKSTTGSTFVDFSGPPTASVESVPTARERNLKALYDEDEKIQMLLNIIRNETIIQNNTSRDLLLQMNSLVEDREETWLECEMNRRYLLEAAVMHRGYLCMPRSPLDRIAYPMMTPLACHPFAMKVEDLDDSDWTETKRKRGFSVYSEKFECYNPLFISTSTGLIQTGEPFDIKYHRLKNTLNIKQWATLDRNLGIHIYIYIFTYVKYQISIFIYILGLSTKPCNHISEGIRKLQYIHVYIYTYISLYML